MFFVVEEQEHPRSGEAFMTIVGCDFHPGWQQGEVFDPETGEVQQLKLANGNGEAERFYRHMPAPSLVGIEACGNTQWFEDLLERLGHELWIPVEHLSRRECP
jgi:transposase